MITQLMANLLFSTQVARGQTILESLRDKGHEVPTSCESGTCGTCRIRILAGQADHRDLVLVDQERSDKIIICNSQALSDEIAIDR